MTKNNLLKLIESTNEIFVNWINVPTVQWDSIRALLKSHGFVSDDVGCPQETFIRQ